VVVVDTDDASLARPARATILFDASHDRSLRAAAVLQRALGTFADTLVARRLAERELPAAFTKPLIVRDRSVAPAGRTTASLAGRVLPLLLVLITLLGAFYPAIDLAAGEKERGTLEPLLMTATPAWVILTGKFLTVAAVGVTSAAVNLGSMLLTVRVGLFSLPGQLGIDTALPVTSVLFAFFTLVPLAVLFAGLFLGIAVRAHSFKEAQNALTPVYVLVLIPAILPAIPGIELTPGLAAAPVAGVTLLLRDLLVGRDTPLTAMIALGSTAFYAAAALFFAARSFGSEHVLFGKDDAERRNFWRSLFVAPANGHALPTLGQATAFMLFVAALYFYGGRTFVHLFGGADPRLGILAAQWLLLFVPALLFIRLTGVRYSEVLGLRRPSLSQTGAATLLVLGAVPIGILIAWFQTRFFALPEGVVEALRSLLIPATGRDALIIALTAAVTPAICEEVVFRGVFLSSTRRLHWAGGILLSAVVFGLFHVTYETAIRFLPTFWLGLVLGWTVWWTRSLWLAALMHALHNGLLLLLASAGARATAPSNPSSSLSLSVLAVALAMVVLGARLVRTASEDSPRRRARVAPGASVAAAEDAATAP
jgi:sodium transport system permease protein